ncbi:MAG: sigma-70 family RNA polymerase sigma factor [Verrucomicrobiaceae bacterium]|nr:sigma-70 family RNA polymerase sigma factor [Verrucomicrobiaceae bacterium]
MPPTEAELIRLHTAHAERVFRYAWSITKEEVMAEDVVQELFLKLARDASSINSARSESAMLLTMTRNLALDLLRRAKSRDSTQKRWAAELPEWFDSAEDHDLAHQQSRLTAALASLPEEQRSAVHLHVWEGLTFREIGEMSGLPAQTIASRYRYGLTKLRAALETSPTP